MTMAQLLALIDVEAGTDGKPAGYGRPARPEEWLPEGTTADWAMLGSMRLGG